jgi:hypothetical protein
MAAGVGNNSVSQSNHPFGVPRNVFFVGHYYQGVPGRVDLVKQLQNFVRSCRVEVSSGLVGQNERGLVYQGPGDRYALALSARELVGLVVHPVA